MITSIPTAARGKVRAFLKAHQNFDAFAASLGVESRNVLNADLLVFAANEGILDDVQAIIDEATLAPLRGKVAHDHYADALRGAVNGALNKAIDNVIEADLAAANVTRAFDLDTVLADVDQFLSPVVRKSLAESLMPILDAANKPEVVREVEKVVLKDAPLVAPMGQVPYATLTGKTLPFNKLFGTRTLHAFGQKPISLWESHGMAPSVDPYFVIDAEPMAALATAAEHETNVWLVGPSGAGKSSMPRQFAAYTGRPFTLIQFTKQTSVQELVGGKGAENGSTKWEDGSLIAAMKRPGMVIFIDEPTLAPAGVQAIIQNVTDDHRTYTIHETGEVVRCAPGVMFVIADNTNGTGDETGQYAGTNQANTALVNRFKRMIKIDYLTKAQETAALMNHCPGTPQDAAEHIVDFMQRARKLPEMEGIALSLRQMVGFVGMVKDGFSAKYSMECAILVKLPATERAALETMATLQWTDAFEKLVSGVPLSNMPSNSAGAAAFDDETSAELNR